jgi:ssDNA-binding Zn-finger/Zn-ribbon topoisomerase 1
MQNIATGMDNTVECECCGKETDISFERTRFLRWLVDNNHMTKGHYIQVVDKLDLPDPNRMAKARRKDLLGKLFAINRELRHVDNEKEIEKLKMTKRRIHEKLQNNFSPGLGTKEGEFDIESLK